MEGKGRGCVQLIRSIYLSIDRSINLTTLFYIEYMAKIYYHDLPSVLCKILGVYTIRYDNKESGRKLVENVVVMENIFYQVG